MAASHQAAAGVTSSAAGKYSGTITAGDFGTLVGLSVGAMGSRSPTTLTDGKTFLGLWDDVTGVAESKLTISGFGADPGASYIQAITANGVSRTGASATYVYSAGSSTWAWSVLYFGFVTTNVYGVSMS